MALSREDKNDVKKAYGKALANKVAKVTRDNHAMKGVSWAVNRARHKTYGKDANLTGKKALEAEYRHAMKVKGPDNPYKTGSESAKTQREVWDAFHKK